jgi:hypothetical protein
VATIQETKPKLSLHTDSGFWEKNDSGKIYLILVKPHLVSKKLILIKTLIYKKPVLVKTT